MSWDPWAQYCLTSNTEKRDPASSFVWLGDQNGAPWATVRSPDAKTELDVKPDEIKRMMKIISGDDQDFSNGVYLGGERFVFINRVPDDCLVCKKGTTGFTIAKGKSCALLGYYEEGIQPGNNRNRVCEVRDMLKDQGH